MTSAPSSSREAPTLLRPSPLGPPPHRAGERADHRARPNSPLLRGPRHAPRARRPRLPLAGVGMRGPRAPETGNENYRLRSKLVTKITGSGSDAHGFDDGPQHAVHGCRIPEDCSDVRIEEDRDLPGSPVREAVRSGGAVVEAILRAKLDPVPQVSRGPRRSMPWRRSTPPPAGARLPVPRIDLRPGALIATSRQELHKAVESCRGGR